MKRKCKLIAILTTAILLLTSAAAVAETIVIIEDIPMGDLYLPAVVAEENAHKQNKKEEMEVVSVAPAHDDELLVVEEDMDDDEMFEVIAAPIKPVAEGEEDEEEWIAPPQIVAEDEAEMIVAPIAPIAEDEMAFEGEEALDGEEADEQTAIADISLGHNGDKIFLGDTVTFTASVEDGANVRWQQRKPGQGWTDMSGEHSATLHIVVTGDNADNTWRCLVTA